MRCVRSAGVESSVAGERWSSGGEHAAVLVDTYSTAEVMPSLVRAFLRRVTLVAWLSWAGWGCSVGSLVGAGFGGCFFVFEGFGFCGFAVGFGFGLCGGSVFCDVGGAFYGDDVDALGALPAVVAAVEVVDEELGDEDGAGGGGWMRSAVMRRGWRCTSGPWCRRRPWLGRC